MLDRKNRANQVTATDNSLNYLASDLNLCSLSDEVPSQLDRTRSGQSAFDLGAGGKNGNSFRISSGFGWRPYSQISNASA